MSYLDTQVATTRIWFQRIPTSRHVCVAKKSFSSTEDAKKIRKELGIKPDDVRNYFQPSNPLRKSTMRNAEAASALAAANEKY
jgi:hypothetical protein